MHIKKGSAKTSRTFYLCYLTFILNINFIEFFSQSNAVLMLCSKILSGDHFNNSFAFCYQQQELQDPTISSRHLFYRNIFSVTLSQDAKTSLTLFPSCVPRLKKFVMPPFLNILRKNMCICQVFNIYIISNAGTVFLYHNPDHTFQKFYRQKMLDFKNIWNKMCFRIMPFH